MSCYQRYTKLMILPFALVTLLQLAGCASKSPYHFYTLKPLTTAEYSSRSGEIGIAPVEIPGWLDHGRISWNDGDVSVVTMSNDRWGEPFSKVIDQVMVQNLSRLLPLSRITKGPWTRSTSPDQIISLRILSLVRSDHELKLEVSIEILNKDRKIVTSQYEIYRQPLSDESSVTGFVQSLSTLLTSMSIDIKNRL